MKPLRLTAETARIVVAALAAPSPQRLPPEDKALCGEVGAAPSPPAAPAPSSAEVARSHRDLMTSDRRHLPQAARNELAYLQGLRDRNNTHFDAVAALAAEVDARAPGPDREERAARLAGLTDASRAFSRVDQARLTALEVIDNGGVTFLEAPSFLNLMEREWTAEPPLSQGDVEYLDLHAPQREKPPARQSREQWMEARRAEESVRRRVEAFENLSPKEQTDLRAQAARETALEKSGGLEPAVEKAVDLILNLISLHDGAANDEVRGSLERLHAERNQQLVRAHGENIQQVLASGTHKLDPRRAAVLQDAQRWAEMYDGAGDDKAKAAGAKLHLLNNKARCEALGPSTPLETSTVNAEPSKMSPSDEAAIHMALFPPQPGSGRSASSDWLSGQ